MLLDLPRSLADAVSASAQPVMNACRAPCAAFRENAQTDMGVTC
jgi:hypothetical protein